MDTGCRRKRNGNMPAAPEARPHIFLETMLQNSAITHGLQKMPADIRVQWARSNPIRAAFTTFAGTFGNGAMTFTASTITRNLLERTHAARKLVTIRSSVAAPGK